MDTEHTAGIFPEAVSDETPANPQDAPTEIPYAFHRLSESADAVKRLLNSMLDLRKELDQYLSGNKREARAVMKELQLQKGALLESLDVIRYCLLEMEQDSLAAYTGKLKNSISGFNLLTPDYGKLKTIVEDFIQNRLPIGKRVSTAAIGRLINQVRMGYYPTDPNNLDLILKGIRFPEGVTTNLLDPCCGCGHALRRLADGNNAFTFGVELDEARASDAETRLHRVGHGSYFYSKISANAFHLLFLNPPYLPVITPGGGTARDEKRFLVDSMQHLTMGGLLIYIVPYYRLTPDICRILCGNFQELTVYRFLEPEFSRFHQVAVMGLRKKRDDGSMQAQELNERVVAPENIPLLSEILEEAYEIPAAELQVHTFRGSVFNQMELYRQLCASDSYDRLLKKSALDDCVKRPLLPLNIGQVGLIGGSGMINGLIDCETPHIIKGRMVKQKVTRSEENYVCGKHASTDIYETISNKMVFNILTPDSLLALT